MGLLGKALVVGDVTGVALYEAARTFPYVQTEPTPAGSKRDPLLAKAQLISDSGSISVRTHLRRRKPR